MAHRSRAIVVLFVACLAAACAPAPARTATASGASSGPTVSSGSGAPASLATTSDRYFIAAGVRIRYRTIGNGDPVILLHGFTRDLSDWRGIGDSLARDHRVVALDWRGSGQSSKPADPARYGAEMLDDVARLMDHLGISRAHVIGHSMGATGASGLVVRHPGRVRTLVLVAGLYGDSAFMARTFASEIVDLGKRPDLAPLDRDALIAVLRNVPTSIVPSQTASVRVPVLAIVGTADFNLASTRELAARWPAMRVQIVEGAGHGDVLARAELLAAVRAHLGGR